jgi:prepilin-type N-terminal cleavage/methylation domain-containing protein/prepilin-type processing-associated H-X9-DG protein
MSDSILPPRRVLSSERNAPAKTRIPGFTLVELLVVTGIIALLIAMLLPTLGKAREASRAVACQSNMRQIGIGFRMYAEANKAVLPSSGDDGDPGSPILMPDKQGWASDALWMNAVSKTVFGKTYNQIQLDAKVGKDRIPNEGDHHVLVCPSAPRAAPVPNATNDSVSPDGYFQMFGYINNGATVEQRNTFICYAMNFKLWGSSSNTTGKITQIHNPAQTTLVFEKRTSVSEITANDDAYYVAQGGAAGKILTAPVGRFRGDWRRFSSRHGGGGYCVFADGHVAKIPLHDVLTATKNGTDWNHYNSFVWTATGVAGQ